MNNKTKFSIIIPCYNSEKYLFKAVNSVLEQNYDNFELILINDGSNDLTEQLLLSYIKIDRRVIAISQKNMGYSGAINTGLRHVSKETDYVIFLGSDDYLNGNLLKTIDDNILSFFPDVIAFKVIKSYLKTNQTVNESLSNFRSNISFEGNFESFYKKYPKEAEFFCTRDTGKAFFRNAINDNYVGKTGLDADYIFSTLVAFNSNAFLVIPDDGYYWTLRPDSISGRKPSFSSYVERISNWYYFLTKIENKKVVLTPFLFKYIEVPFDCISKMRKQSFIKTLSYYFLIKRYIKKYNCFLKNNNLYSSSGKRNVFINRFPFISLLFNFFV